MGRATSGVIGMRFRDGDELLAMEVVRPGSTCSTATDGGLRQAHARRGVPRPGTRRLRRPTAKIIEARGPLVGALVVQDDDEVFAITSGGGVIRTRVDEVRRTGRDTMGVRLVASRRR